MKTILIAVTLSTLAWGTPVVAEPPGHWSLTSEFLVYSYLDFKYGVGIADPSDYSNLCTVMLIGVRGFQPATETWEADQNIGTNLNGPAAGVSTLSWLASPPLESPGGWLPEGYSYGVDLGIPCPLESGSGNLWLVWSGMNWYSAQHHSVSKINLCTQRAFVSSSPGCLPTPSDQARLWASACNGPLPAHGTFFGSDHQDGKGKYLGGQPYKLLRMKSDVVKCPVRHSVDYTDTIQDFTAGQASQTFDMIKNEAVVRYGSGTTYMAVCWRIDYLDFVNPLSPMEGQANTHDWKLILDLEDLGTDTGLGNVMAALDRHYGGAAPGDNDNDIGGTTVALRGFYSQGAGDPKTAGAGQNGFGPCDQGPNYQATFKKPAPLV